MIEVRSCEFQCLRQFTLFTIRHVRYGFIALTLYGLSLRSWVLAKRLRHGFCALQLIDDLLDGDRACEREPKTFVTEALSSKKCETDLEELVSAFRYQIKEIPERDEIHRLFDEVVAAMIFDRDRVLSRMQLSAHQLRSQHHRTFSASLDLVLACMQSKLRVKDVPAILDVFAWCSMFRDLEEDLAKGLVNIPIEVFEGQWPAAVPSVTWAKDERVHKWLACEADEAMRSITESRRILTLLPDENGKKVFHLFLNSMSRYLKKVQHVSLAPAL